MGPADVDPEWVAFAAGLKPAIRLTAEPGGGDALVARFGALGAAVVRGRGLANVGGRSVELVYVARSAEHALALRAAEEAMTGERTLVGLDAELGAHLELGRRLGFPRCCVEAFCRRIEADVRSGGATGWSRCAEDYAVARHAWVEHADGLLNHLLFAARLRLISFYPCRYDCAVAGGYAAAVLRAIAAKQPEVARALHEALARPVAIAPTNARAVLGIEGTRITHAEAPIGRDGRVISQADADFAASLVGRDVGPDGSVLGGGAEDADPPWVVRFG